MQNIRKDFVVHEFVHMMAEMIFKLRIKVKFKSYFEII